MSAVKKKMKAFLTCLQVMLFLVLASLNFLHLTIPKSPTYWDEIGHVIIIIFTTTSIIGWANVYLFLKKLKTEL